MNGLNLIPAHRRTAKRLAACCRAWIMAGIAYTIVLIGACVLAGAIWDVNSDQVKAELAQTSKRITERTTAVNATRAELSETKGKLQMVQSISDPPDWSVLLCVLAAKPDDEVMFNGLELSPIAASASRSANAAKPAEQLAQQPAAFQFELRGNARSQPAVSRVIAQLEDLKLFDDVKLMRSARTAFGPSSAINFQIQAALDGGKD